MSNQNNSIMHTAKYSYPEQGAIPLITFLKTRYHYMDPSLYVSTFTPPLKKSCPVTIAITEVLVPKTIIIMTNSICFGACDLLVSKAALLPGIMTFKVGGSPKYPFIFASSPDFESIPMEEILFSFQSHPGSSPPPKFYTSSVARMIVSSRQFINIKGGLALWRHPIVADHHILTLSPTSLPIDLWDQILQKIY